MPRWRISTWAFIGWNVVMVALLVSNLLADRCADMPYGSGLTACAMGAAFEMLFAFLAIALIGVIVIGGFWLRGRPRGGAQGPPTPSDVRSVTGSDADAVLADAASAVAEWKTQGRSLVEAAWMSKRQSRSDGPLLLNVAFGDPGVHYWALWPDGEDAMEAVLARVGFAEEEWPKADG